MRKKLGLLILFLILPCFFSLSQAAEAPHAIRWQAWSLDVFKQARSEHKLVLIFGKVSWCHWCQKMEGSTFPDPRVVQLIHSSYVPVKVDLDQDVAVSNRYKITEIPTLIVLDEHNKELKRFYGYSSSQGVLRELGGLVTQYR